MKINLIKQLALLTDTMRIARDRNLPAVAGAAFESLKEQSQQLDGAKGCFLTPNATIPGVTTHGHDLCFLVRGTEWERETGSIARYVILAEENLETGEGDFLLIDCKKRTVSCVTIDGIIFHWKRNVTLEEWIQEMEA